MYVDSDGTTIEGSVIDHNYCLVHLWRYSGGFDAIGEANQKMSNLVWYREMRQKRSHMLLARRNQLLFEFSFWNSPEPRPGPNIYELRTYKLKVG